MRRRKVIALITLLGAGLVKPSTGGATLSEAKLSADMTSEDLANVLHSFLIGQSTIDVKPLLEGHGAKDIVFENLANSGIEAGYDLGHGARAGDRVLIAAFGLARGWFRSDRPAVVYLRYEDGRIAEIISVKISSK